MMRVVDAALALGARVVGDGQTLFDSVGSDSRHIVGGQLFVALRGDKFDGHDFVRDAALHGAAAALVDEHYAAQIAAETKAGAIALPLLITADTRHALGRLAAHWRSLFSLPLIGITGSNGKTSVKEMCAAILRQDAESVHLGAEAVLATSGNLNNDIGMPMMLLRLRPHHRHAVLEMGMNHPGEIAELTQIARPTVALVTNAQRAHLEGLGGVDAIAREKGCIYAGLGNEGCAVVNADDAFAPLWLDLNRGRKVLRFGLQAEAAEATSAAASAEICAHSTLDGLGAHLQLTTPVGNASFDLRVPGLHNVRNALAATAACLAAGARLESIVEGLSQYTGTPGRLHRRNAAHGATLLDDTYNANPDSVRAGIDVLAATAGRKILVLGDMGEIGLTSAQLHDEVGGYAKSVGIDQLFALGEMSEVAARNFGDGGRHFLSASELVNTLRKQLDPHTVVLVKGSRFMRMERVVEALANDAPSAHREAS